MFRSIGTFLVALIVLWVIAAERPVRADTVPGHHPTRPCREAQINDPSLVFERMRRDQIVRRYEVIIEGIVASYTPPEARRPGLIVMRVDKIWKGEVAPRAAWPIYPTGFLDVELPSPLNPADCPLKISVSQRIRVASDIAGKVATQVAAFPDLDPNTDVLDRSHSRWSLVYLPLSDPELDRLLTAYQTKTDALRQAAATGDLQAKLAFATHLLQNNQRHRAEEIVDALRRDGVNLAPIGTLLLDPERKNWSDLKRIRSACYSDHGNFDNAAFDRADLAACAFRYSSFREASFRGTDLTGSYFQNSDLTGAKYDCATKLPDDLDPAAAGMVNVGGSCPPTSP